MSCFEEHRQEHACVGFQHLGSVRRRGLLQDQYIVGPLSMPWKEMPMSMFLPIDKKDLDISAMEEPTPAERLTVSLQPELNEAVAELSNPGSSFVFSYLLNRGMDIAGLHQHVADRYGVRVEDITLAWRISQWDALQSTKAAAAAQ